MSTLDLTISYKDTQPQLLIGAFEKHKASAVVSEDGNKITLGPYTATKYTEGCGLHIPRDQGDARSYGKDVWFFTREHDETPLPKHSLCNAQGQKGLDNVIAYLAGLSAQNDFTAGEIAEMVTGSRERVIRVEIKPKGLLY